jgi:hypothetical protein
MTTEEEKEYYQKRVSEIHEKMKPLFQDMK